MPTTTPLTDAINALTRYANETTGASDTTLSDAVGTLVAGYGGGGGSNIMKWKASRSTFFGLQGLYDVAGVELDYDGKANNTPAHNYFAFNTVNGSIKLTGFTGFTGSQQNMTEFCRQSPTVNYVDFGGLAPAAMTRWFYQWNTSQNGQKQNTAVTLVNLCLDNLATNTNSFTVCDNDQKRIVSISFTGALKNSINISGWDMVNYASFESLIEHLYDYSGSGNTYTLTLGNTILTNIDQAHKDLAVARGWTLA